MIRFLIVFALNLTILSYAHSANKQQSPKVTPEQEVQAKQEANLVAQSILSEIFSSIANIQFKGHVKLDSESQNPFKITDLSGILQFELTKQMLFRLTPTGSQKGTSTEFIPHIALGDSGIMPRIVIQTNNQNPHDVLLNALFLKSDSKGPSHFDIELKNGHLGSLLYLRVHAIEMKGDPFLPKGVKGICLIEERVTERRNGKSTVDFRPVTCNASFGWNMEKGEFSYDFEFDTTKNLFE